jgi:uncharacterized membrane protein required for colicin V production
MIPVEYLWITVWLFFGIIGAARGLSKELGTSTIVLLSLFALKIGWEQIGSRIVQAVPGGQPPETVEAIYYISVIVFVAFISYEGIVLHFPMRNQSGVLKGFFGFLGGLLNGYLIVGTIWDAVNKADYFGMTVPYGSTGQMVTISNSVTELHNAIAQYLPITFVNQWVLLILGMILLLAIVLR